MNTPDQFSSEYQQQEHPQQNQPQPQARQAEYEGISLPKTLLVLFILSIIAGSIMAALVLTKPEAKKGKPPKTVVAVEVINTSAQDYPIKVSANGTITAATRSTLVSQVSGEIIEIAPFFANGGRFEQGDVFLKIDGRDFLAQMESAQAALSQAQASLLQEKATAAQAQKDWQRLGFTGEPNDLVLRKPQLAAASAQLNSAKAAFNKAKLDFSRTQIRAPYAGYVINQEVDLGQFVTTGSRLGEIFSSEGLEVELPLNQNQYAQLDINSQPAVILSATLAGQQHQWSANIIRADSIFDTNTRQLNATAKITNPISDGGLELKIGQYVTAEIAGQIAQQALVIPNKAIREGNYVFLLEEGILRRRDIDIVWQDKRNSVVTGLVPNEQVVTTSLSGSLNGTAAKVTGLENKPSSKPAGASKPGNIDSTTSKKS